MLRRLAVATVVVMVGLGLVAGAASIGAAQSAQAQVHGQSRVRQGDRPLRPVPRDRGAQPRRPPPYPRQGREEAGADDDHSPHDHAADVVDHHVEHHDLEHHDLEHHHHVEHDHVDVDHHVDHDDRAADEHHRRADHDDDDVPVTACTPAHPGLTPCDLQAAYLLPSTTAGVGKTVAIVDAYDDPNAEADLAVYRAAYGLPPCTTANGCFRKVNQSGGTTYPRANIGWAEEISLDVDMVSAVCQNCHILLVEASTNSTTNLIAAEATAGRLGADAISNSWGAGESSSEATWDNSLPANVTITASAGDNGYGPSWPAASPKVVAVGGTKLVADTSSRGWSETVWTGTGSGCSKYESKSSWQTDTGCSKRTIGDVAAIADPATGVVVYDHYGEPGWMAFGGTSVSSPLIASVYALAGNSKTATAGQMPYNTPSGLYDVTSGSNGSCSPAYLCTGQPGYDGPTGLGTPNGIAAF